MIFSSLYFMFFFMPAFFIVYFALKKRSHKNVVLLAFSLVFYAWGEPIYILLMMFSITVDYFIGRAIGRAHEADNDRRAKNFMILSIVTNMMLLGVFKYADFLIETVNGIAGTGLPLPNLPLPIGISFYTFQTMSYIIDLYKKKVPVQKNILYLGAYMCMFPQLVAGPIVRYEIVVDQLENRKETMDDFAAGLRRFIAGLMKKIFIADQMAYICDRVLASPPEMFGALGMWLAIFAFSMQIYFDFSGYSDMAIGLGRMMGFKYPENFNYPYIAKSVGEFWRRWHMTLSYFFRDYVYIPLGGNRVKFGRWVFNIAVVWLLTGLWHGAAWNFILWGVYFGALLFLERVLFSKNILKVPVLCNVYTIIAFSFGWILFRAESLGHIGTILSAMAGNYGRGSLFTLASAGVLSYLHLIVIVFAIICCMPVSQKIKAYLENAKKPALPALIDVAAAGALIFCIVQLANGAYSPFIYFRF